MKLAAIVIPIYKSTPNVDELVSFRQGIDILKNYDFSLVCPEGLDITIYIQLLKEHKANFEVQLFPDHFFRGIPNYNALMLSTVFYKRFRGFKYILIYQLDAFVFRDDLKYWCDLNYDYIGAPWFEGWGQGNSVKSIGVGNGGFSLRQISKSLKVLSMLWFFMKCKKLYDSFRFNKLCPFSKFIYSFNVFFRIKKNYEVFDRLMNKWTLNEDLFWGKFAPEIFDYKVAPYEKALQFSFEVNPSFLYLVNNQQLPFGCHAWEKYEPEFWKKFIKTAE